MISSVTILSALAAASSAVVTSDFTFDAEGWRVVSYGGTDYTGTPTDYGVATYNAGGYITSTDPDGGDFFFAAPSKFLGDVSIAYGTDLTYDLANTGSGYTAAATVVLKGGGLTAAFNSIQDATTFFSPFVIPLTEAGWSQNTYGGAAISQADFKTILSNLTSLEIRGEYVFGGETASLDNVNLQAVPEPGSMAALGLGALALLRRRRRA